MTFITKREVLLTLLLATVNATLSDPTLGSDTLSNLYNARRFKLQDPNLLIDDTKRVTHLGNGRIHRDDDPAQNINWDDQPSV